MKHNHYKTRSEMSSLPYPFVYCLPEVDNKSDTPFTKKSVSAWVAYCKGIIQTLPKIGERVVITKTGKNLKGLPPYFLIGGVA